MAIVFRLIVTMLVGLPVLLGVPNEKHLILKSGGLEYEAIIYFPWEIVVCTIKPKTQLFQFREFKDLIGTFDDFRAGDFDGDGSEEVAFKGRKKAPDSSGFAIVYSPSKRELYRLDYLESGRLKLSANLHSERSEKLRRWLIEWWAQWPGPSAEYLWKLLQQEDGGSRK